MSEALNSRRADSPGPSVPSRSKKPTPCLYKITVRTGSSAGSAGCANTAARKIDIRRYFKQASLFAHRFNNDAFRTLSVELGVIYLLPGAEIELAFSHRHDRFVMHQQALQVGIPVGLAGAVMPVIRAK